ncbi:adhesion G-protein coupled receptor G4 [Misgurnus anguillicaudatus]|uniref:adhesion G-protein coupled receptor G4 n=1 Tax=Misgurnus anguillicaudatus TaxID=75329 RepID=UPI003CCF2021
MHIIIKYLPLILYTWIFVSSYIRADVPNASLWGKRVNFWSQTCLWQLRKQCIIPPLEELSVCVDLRRQLGTSEWTAFVYKGPGGQDVELGLAGVGGNLKVSLFGKEWIVAQDLALYIWHTVCLTWSSHARLFQLIVNGANHTFHLNETFPRFLETNGTLTLGVSHSYVGGVIDFETGKNFLGDIYLFRMWGEQLSALQLDARKCVDGNIVTWREKDWHYQECPPISDKSLKCEWSKYQIQMNTSITQKTNDDYTENEMKKIVLTWLGNVFPETISVHSVFLSKLSSQTGGGLDQYNDMQKKVERKSNKKQWFDCLVFVKKTPGADVSETEAEIEKLLKPSYKYEYIILKTDPTSISVLSVAYFPNDDPALTTAVTTKYSNIGTTNITASVTPTSLQTRVMESARSSTTISKTDTDFGDTFFRVYLNLTMSGSITFPETTLQQWLQQTLGDHAMEPLNIVLTRLSKYISSFQVKASGKVDVKETKRLMVNLLTQGYSNATINITVPNNEVNILHIEPGLCPEETMHTVYGIYTWPEMTAQNTYSMGCEKGDEDASRFCKLNGATDRAVWDPPDMSMCMTTVSGFDDLENIEVTVNNSANIVNLIADLLNKQNSLSDKQLNIVLNKLSAVTKIATLTTDLSSSIINILSQICEYTTNLAQVTNEILYITDLMGDRTEFDGAELNITAPSLALQLINPDTSQFSGLTFGVSSFQTGSNPEIFFNKVFSEEPNTIHVASISLPSTVENFFPNNEAIPRVQFHFYGKENLFQDTQSGVILNSYVVSASITNATVSDLEIPVVVTFQNLQPKEDQSIVKCVFWDFSKNNGRGGWNDTGCEVKTSNTTHTLCVCDHLTHFGVLLDISKTPIKPEDEKILTVISYLGSGVSCIFLGVTLLTYVAFEKLRRDNPSKILINLSVALLGLNMFFLVNSWFASFNSNGLCIAVAAVLHYFFLAAFTWMGLEAINMYLALVKVFNSYVPSYILKFCALGWGLPLVIVSLVLAIDADSYGNSFSNIHFEKSTQFCWINKDITFYVTVVSFVILILICNIAVFIVVLVQIKKMRVNKPLSSRKGLLHDLRVVASLTFLLGLTWLPAFLAWGPAKTPLLYVFSILNSLQGFFIFLFYCLMKDNVRKQWRIHLCCGSFRLTEYSDWSRSVTVGAKVKGGLQVSTSTKSETSSDRKISDSSHSGSNHDHVCLTHNRN